MASIKMIPEDEATGKSKTTYEEIMSGLGTDFVPNLTRSWPPNLTIWKRIGAKSKRS